MAVALLLCVTLIGSLLSSGLKADDVVIVSDRWYPYSSTPNSPNPGYAIEIAQYALHNGGHTVTYQLWSKRKGTALVRSGKKHCIVSYYHRNIADFIFPQQAIARDENIFIRRNSINWLYTGISSLKKITLGTIHGYRYSDELTHYIETLSNPIAITNTKGMFALENNLSALIEGDIDVVVGSKAVLEAALKKNNWQGHVSYAGSTGGLVDIYIACSPKIAQSHQYARLINQGIIDLRVSGELDVLLKKYQLSDSQ